MLKYVFIGVLVVVASFLMYSLWQSGIDNRKEDAELKRIRSEETMTSEACIAYGQSHNLNATFVNGVCYVYSADGTYTELK